jgi:two-component system response regulator PilR (NtrC family)
MARILVVDDERSMREFLEILLSKQGHDVSTAEHVAGARAAASEGGLDLVVTDLRLGDGSGLDVLREVKARSPGTEVVVVTAFATTENAVQAMKLGAYDYVLKPFKVDELLLALDKALEHRALLAENRVLRHRAGRRREEEEILGTAPAMDEVRSLVARVARARTTVLVTGESGTGKEVVARAIHQGAGAAQPFVAINCAAIPEGLIESELFGHEKGAFTGAVGAKAGLFEVAGTGTLFLDEVGELPPAVQVKLLRTLQERKIRHVGGSADIAVGARIVAATNRDLAEEVRAGRFREDLFYRLNVIQLRVPALRERPEDVPLFVSHFLRRFAEELGRPVPRVDPAAERLLVEWHWPGNVRELANVLERAITLCTGDVIGPDALPEPLRRAGPSDPEGAARPAGTTSATAAELPAAGLDLQAHLDATERAILEQALARAGGVKTEAARLLSLSYRSLRYRLTKFGMG